MSGFPAYLRVLLNGKFAIYNVYKITKPDGTIQFRVRISVGKRKVDSGSFSDEKFVCLAADHICSVFLSGSAVNCPGRQLDDHAELKRGLNWINESGTRSEASSCSEVDRSPAIQQEFWNAVQYGPESVCC